MKILFLSDHCCIRVIKESLVVRPDMLCNRIAVQSTAPAIRDPIYFFDGTREGLFYKLASMPEYDIIHVHNTPDWLVNVAADFAPVIYDVHDIGYYGMSVEEKQAYQAASGVIFVGESEYQARKEYVKVPHEIIYSYCNMIVEDHGPRIGGVVYEGGLWTEGFRDLRDTFKSLKIPVTAYSEVTDPYEYQKLGVTLSVPILSYPLLLKELSRYDWGFVGFKEPLPAMPNKLFEYIAAGIPILYHNAGKEVEDFVEKHGIGTSIKNIGNRETYKNNIDRLKYNMVMEKQRDKLFNLYREVLDGRIDRTGDKSDRRAANF